MKVYIPVVTGEVTSTLGAFIDKHSALMVVYRNMAETVPPKDIFELTQDMEETFHAEHDDITWDVFTETISD